MKKQDKVAKVMREFKSGELKSSSGKKVTSPKQAIAIGLSEAGLSKPKMKEGGSVQGVKKHLPSPDQMGSLGMKRGGQAKGSSMNRMKSKGEHSVQTKSKRGAEMVKMAKGGMAKKYRMGGETTSMRDSRAEAAGRKVTKDIEYDEKMRGMKKGGAVKKMAKGGSACSYKKDADGVAKRGRTKPMMMRKGGKVC